MDKKRPEESYFDTDSGDDLRIIRNKLKWLKDNEGHDAKNNTFRLWLIEFDKKVGNTIVGVDNVPWILQPAVQHEDLVSKIESALEWVLVNRKAYKTTRQTKQKKGKDNGKTVQRDWITFVVSLK
jgi:hypothetical protein